MTARPWMPLYIADYLADTAHLGAAQSGAYMHLIMHYWQHSALPVDDAGLARIAKLTPGEWRRERATLQAFFHDGWRHKRIDAELADATAHLTAKAEAGRKGAAARWQGHVTGNGNPIADASLSHRQIDAPLHSPSQLQKEISLTPKLNGEHAAALASLIGGAVKKAEAPKYVWLKPTDTRVPRAQSWWREHYGSELPIQFKGSKQGYSVPWEAVR